MELTIEGDKEVNAVAAVDVVSKITGEGGAELENTGPVGVVTRCCNQ